MPLNWLFCRKNHLLRSGDCRKYSKRRTTDVSVFLAAYNCATYHSFVKNQVSRDKYNKYSVRQLLHFLGDQLLQIRESQFDTAPVKLKIIKR